MSTESRGRKILKPRGFVQHAHAGALRVNVIVALKAAHRNGRMCCSSWCPYFLRFHTLSSIHDLFITQQAIRLKSFVQLMFVPAAPAHRQNPPVFGNSVPARFSSSVFVVARVLSCTSGRALAYLHIPTRLVQLHIHNTSSFVGGTCKR